MRKFLLNWLAIAATAFIVCYAAGAIIGASFHLPDWSAGTREGVGICFICFSVLGLAGLAIGHTESSK
jgi:hypothetical protein